MLACCARELEALLLRFKAQEVGLSFLSVLGELVMTAPCTEAGGATAALRARAARLSGCVQSARGRWTLKRALCIVFKLLLR